MNRHACLSIVFLAAMAATAAAQEWAKSMFSEFRHDFGTIARSSKAEFEFKFNNKFLEDVHVSNVRASCGCTTPSVKDGKSTLKTYETGSILAHINSDTFTGNRSATLTVTFDKPFYAQVELQVTVYIRDDVVLQPGVVQFGTAVQGAAVERQINITSPGRADLQITGVRNNNPHLSTQLINLRQQGGVGYKLLVRLEESAPAGYINEHFVLLTNDSRLQIPVPVEGIVRAGLTVSPNWLLVGMVPAGERATKQIVVRAQKPFVIRRVIPAAGFECDISGAQEPKALHIVPVIFTAGTQTGRIAQTLRIETDKPDEDVEFVAEAVIIAPAHMVAKPVEQK